MNGKKKNRQEELPAGTRGREAELRGYLYALIEQELEKGDAADLELIRECSDCDAYLTGTDTPLSEEEYQAAMIKIKSLAAPGGKKPRKKRVLWRVAAALVAVLMLLYASLTVIAVNKGTTTADLISRYFDRIWGMNTGDRMDFEGTTVTMGEYTAIYDSMEEAVEKMDMDILYPTYLPDGIRIKQVSVLYFGEEIGNKILFVTNDIDVCNFSIKDRVVTPSDAYSDKEAYEAGGVTYRVMQAGDWFQAFTVRNGFEYYIGAANKDELLKILDGMRPMKP